MSVLLTLQPRKATPDQVLRNYMSKGDVVAQYMKTSMTFEGKWYGWRI